MALALLAGHSFELAHIGSRDRRTDHDQVIDSCRFRTILIVYHKDLKILHILELYVAQWN